MLVQVADSPPPVGYPVGFTPSALPRRLLEESHTDAIELPLQGPTFTQSLIDYKIIPPPISDFFPTSSPSCVLPGRKGVNSVKFPKEKKSYGAKKARLDRIGEYGPCR